MTTRVLTAAAVAAVAGLATADLDTAPAVILETYFIDIDDSGAGDGSGVLNTAVLPYPAVTGVGGTFTLNPAFQSAGCETIDGDYGEYTLGAFDDPTQADWVPSNFAAQGAGAGSILTIAAIPVDCDNDGIVDQAVDASFNLIPNSRVYNVLVRFGAANPFSNPAIRDPAAGLTDVMFPTGIPTEDAVAGTDPGDFHTAFQMEVGLDDGDPKLQFNDYPASRIIAQEGDSVGGDTSTVVYADSFGRFWVDPPAPNFVPEPTDWVGGSGWAYRLLTTIEGGTDGLGLTGFIWAGGIPGDTGFNGDLGTARPYRAFVDVAVGVVEDTTVNPCPQDINGDTILDVFDIIAFFDLFGNGDLTADFEPDGILNIFDILAYFDLFAQPCPGSSTAPVSRIDPLSLGAQPLERVSNR